MLLPKVRLNTEVAGFLGDKLPELRNYAITSQLNSAFPWHALDTKIVLPATFYCGFGLLS
jgi:hypothetical protein